MPTLEEQIQALTEQLNQPQTGTLPPGPSRRGADDGASQSWTGLLGEVLSGGQSPNYRLAGSERNLAGNRALMNFGINMMLASGPRPYRPDIFSGFAEGLQGAQHSFDLSQRQAQAAAQQDYQNRLELAKLGVEQNRDKVERIKALLPLLQMQQRSEPLPGEASSGGGGPGGGQGGYGDQLTGDITKDEQIIIKRESGGDPTALNYVARADPEARKRGATASGLYGFTDSTWKEGLQMVGGDAGKYPTAQSAPESVQRQVFQAVYKARGTAPWDSRTWGQNWVKGPDGKYTLVATPKGGGVATRTGGTDVAGPPGTVPIRTPPPVAQAPGAPAQPAPPAPAPVSEAMPEADARTAAAKTGKPVPLLGADGKPSGTFMMPSGNVSATGVPEAGGATPATPAAPEPRPGSLEAYLKEHSAHMTPDKDTEASFSTQLSPEQEANIQEQRRQAETALKDQYALQHQGNPKADVQGARLKLAELKQAENTLRENARKQGEDARNKWIEARRKELADAYSASTLATTNETKAQADHRRALELQEAQQEGQFVTDQKKKFGDSQQGAYDQIDSLQTLRRLSDAIPGQATLTPDIRNLLVRFGMTPDGLNSESARVQAFESALSRTVIELRKGVQMGQLSDRDLAFIQNMGPQAMQNPETRAAIIGHLLTAANRKAQYIERVHELYGGGRAAGGMSWSDAVAKARKEIPEFVVPTLPKELMPGYRQQGRDPSIPGPVVDNRQARLDWIEKHVPKGGLVYLPDGTMRAVSLGQ